jgi:hypothetical protein
MDQKILKYRIAGINKQKKKKPLKIAKDKAAKDKAAKEKVITPIKQVERLVSQLNIQKLENKILKKKEKAFQEQGAYNTRRSIENTFSPIVKIFGPGISEPLQKMQ